MQETESAIKLCTKCKKNPRLDGQRWCKDCQYAYNREYYHKHKEHLKEYQHPITLHN